MQSVAIQYERIEWDRPWLQPFSELGRALCDSSDWRVTATQIAMTKNVLNHRGRPIVFVPQESLDFHGEYETFISESGQVPSRHNLHDFFNALVWLTFPQTKARLNELQATCLAAESVYENNKGRRGAVRDAATLFDENAAIWITTDQSLTAHLRDHEWQTLFCTKREDVERTCRVILFGHALLEKLVSPYKGITAHVWNILPPTKLDFLLIADNTHLLDFALAKSMRSDLKTTDFLHLPILGVPSWWNDQSTNFYSDFSVFRPRRKRQASL